MNVNTASNTDGITINIVLNHKGRLATDTTIFDKKFSPKLNSIPRKFTGVPILCPVEVKFTTIVSLIAFSIKNSAVKYNNKIITIPVRLALTIIYPLATLFCLPIIIIVAKAKIISMTKTHEGIHPNTVKNIRPKRHNVTPTTIEAFDVSV